MDINNQNATAFFNAINEDLAGRVKEITSGADKFYNDTVRKAKSDAKAMSRAFLREESFKRGRELGKTVSAARSKAKLVYDERCGDIAREVFGKAAERLREFTKGGEYASFLTSSLEKVLALFGDSPVVIYLRPEDMPLADILTEKAGRECSVREDNTILIGGLKVIGTKKRLSVDDTLDARLEERKEGFFEMFEASVSGDK